MEDHIITSIGGRLERMGYVYRHFHGTFRARMTATNTIGWRHRYTLLYAGNYAWAFHINPQRHMSVVRGADALGLLPGEVVVVLCSDVSLLTPPSRHRACGGAPPTPWHCACVALY